MKGFVCMIALCLLTLSSAAQYNVERLIRSGRVAVYYEDYILGIQYFNQAIAQKPYMYEPWQLRAIAKFNLDDYSGAEADATEAIRLNPYISQIFDLRGISRIRQDNFRGAIEDYDKAAVLDPSNQNYLYNRAICRLQLKEYSIAHAELDTIIRRWKRFASPYILQAEVCLEEGDTTKASEWLERSLDVDPYNAEAWRVRAAICLNKKEWKEADEYYSKVIHFKPKTAGNYVNRAVARLKLNNLRGAMSDYDLALEFEPNNFLAHYNRGLLRQQVGDDNRAIEDFNYVLSLEPDNFMAIFNRATLLDKTGDLRGAIRDYSKVISQFPNFWTGLHYRANCYRRLGMTAKAEMDEFRILKAQMNKHLGIQQRWSRKKLAAIRKKSEIDPEKYNDVVVDDDDAKEHDYKSEYRGKVQNRSVEVQYQPYIGLSVYDYNNGMTNYHPFDKDVDVVNKSLKRNLLKVANLSSQPLGDAKNPFMVVDTLSTKLNASHDVREQKYILLARSIAYGAGQNYDDALRDIDVFLSVDSASALGWWQRAVCGARMAEFDIQDSPQTTKLRIASVLSDFEKAENLAPDNAYLLYCHGTFMAYRQNYAEAQRLLSKALSLDNKLAEAYFNRGLARSHAGDNDGAAADLSKAGELGLYSAYSILKTSSKNNKKK